MEILGVSVWVYLVAWVALCVGTVMFFAGASRLGLDAPVWDEPTELPANVVPFPRRPFTVDADEPPEFKPIIDGEARGWLA